MYLQIEKFRFGDLFEYAFDVDPAAGGLRIPRMSVQLLVENACRHGLQARRDNRRVAVRAKIEDSALAVEVADNGIGMEEERLRQVLDAARSDMADNGHIGIRNLHKRLELYYGGMATLGIDSSPGAGTTAGFRIPLRLLTEDEGREGN
jgi:two-component system sensor histidine kinase YesM